MKLRLIKAACRKCIDSIRGWEDIDDLRWKDGYLACPYYNRALQKSDGLNDGKYWKGLRLFFHQTKEQIVPPDCPYAELHLLWYYSSLKKIDK